MKRILVPVEQTNSMVSTLETALQFARKFESYVEGFALRAALANFVELDGGGAAVFAETLAKQNLAAEKEARNLFEGFMQQRGIACSETQDSVVCYGWCKDAPEGDEFVGSRGRVFDLAVLGRPGADA